MERDLYVGLINSAVQGAMMLSTEECESSKNADEDIIAFVHTFDPSHPDLLWRVKNLVSRIFTFWLTGHDPLILLATRWPRS